MMKCEKCGDTVSPDEVRELAGQILYEDCYLEAIATPKTCDPWALYSAKKTASQNPALTEIQQNILDLIKNKRALTAEEICRQLGIKEEEFRNNFASLRHMELARGCKKDGQVCYVLFDDQSC